MRNKIAKLVMAFKPCSKADCEPCHNSAINITELILALEVEGETVSCVEGEKVDCVNCHRYDEGHDTDFACENRPATIKDLIGERRDAEVK